MLNPDCPGSREGLAAEKSECRWFLPIFVAILCTNLAGPAPALANEGPLTPIAGISKSLAYQEITVQAVIASISPPHGGGPYTVTLSQGGATIPLIYWPDLQPQLGPKLTVGKLVRAKVKVGIYQDRLQLNIRNADAIEVANNGAFGTTNAAPAPGSPPTETVIGKIKTDWVDRAVIIFGTISDSETTGIGWQLKVQDATGEIPVVLGEKTLPGLTVAELQPGRVVTVTGAVKVYDGKPVLVPDVAGAVKLTPQ